MTYRPRDTFRKAFSLMELLIVIFIISLVYYLGFSGVDDVRIGKQIIIKLNTDDKTKAEAVVKEMCETLLANTVIEDYTIEIN